MYIYGVTRRLFKNTGHVLEVGLGSDIVDIILIIVILLRGRISTGVGVKTQPFHRAATQMEVLWHQNFLCKNRPPSYAYITVTSNG